ncbi:MAG: hypothetical protein JXA10_11645 [Anaerolineae bacterium]|nr:hypothetical protein [Anaerolineae bacterium]
MEGIFGVGLAEVLIVLLAMFVIGGPKNTAKWARQLGLWMRQLRQYWAQMMAEIEADLGDDGKELIDAAREFGIGAKQATNLSPQKRVMNETMKTVKNAIDIEANTRDVDAVPAKGTTIKFNTTPAATPKPNGATSRAAASESVADDAVDNASDAASDAASDTTQPDDSEPKRYVAWTAPDHKN